MAALWLPALAAAAQDDEAPDALAPDDATKQGETHADGKAQASSAPDKAQASSAPDKAERSTLEQPSPGTAPPPPVSTSSQTSTYDDLFNERPAASGDGLEQSPEDSARGGPQVEHNGPSEGDPAETTPTIRTYRPPPEPERAPSSDTEREDPGLFGRYFPLTMYPVLDARSADLQPWFFIGGLLPGGQAWLPLLLSDTSPPRGYVGDALLLMFVHVLPHLLILASLPCGFLVIGIPIFGQMLFVSVFLLNLVNVASFLATNFYFVPVALVNAYDRALLTTTGTAQSDGRGRQAQPMAF